MSFGTNLLHFCFSPIIFFSFCFHYITHIAKMTWLNAPAVSWGNESQSGGEEASWMMNSRCNDHKCSRWASLLVIYSTRASMFDEIPIEKRMRLPSFWCQRSPSKTVFYLILLLHMFISICLSFTTFLPATCIWEIHRGYPSVSIYSCFSHFPRTFPWFHKRTNTSQQAVNVEYKTTPVLTPWIA